MGKMERYNSIEEYMQDLPEVAAKALGEVCSYVLEAAPQAKEVVNYASAAYALVEGGKMNKQIIIGAYKNHIGFCPFPATIEYFADELKGYKYSKGTVRFPYNEPIPKDLIIRMVRYRMNQIDEMQGE